MKPRMLASVGAVLLYLWCEFFQGSPFAFLEDGGATVARPTARAVATEAKGDSQEVLRELFEPVRLE